MKCPFLQETEVRSCQSAGIRKLIQRKPDESLREKCSSGGYADCPEYRNNRSTGVAAYDTGAARCPFLYDALVHYCSAASFTKFVPYSDSTATRCSNGGFRYCDIYLNLAHAGVEPGDRVIEGLPMPGRFLYSANHMWLDPAEDGYCHIGIDGFLAKAIQRVDSVTFVTQKGTHRPTVVLSVSGVELHLVFPNPVFIIQPNLYLRADPSRITSDPYCAGWLFEVREIEGRSASANLLEGPPADDWMHRDVDRLSVLAHKYASQMDPSLAGDGGTFGPDLLEHLSREQTMSLFHKFFSPYAGVE